jgi:hypothetical protein
LLAPHDLNGHRTPWFAALSATVEPRHGYLSYEKAVRAVRTTEEARSRSASEQIKLRRAARSIDAVRSWKQDFELKTDS